MSTWGDVFSAQYLKSTPFTGWIFGTIEYVSDWISDTQTMPDGSVIDKKTGETIMLPESARIVTQQGNKPQVEKKINWRNVITVIFVFIGIALFMKLYKLLNISNLLIKKRR